MKMSKIFAGMSAMAIAATMAITACADGLMSKTGNDTGAEIYAIDFTDIDPNSVDKVVAVVSVDSGFCNGCIGWNADGEWTSEDQELQGDGEAIEDEWVVEGLAGTLGTAEDAHMEIQFWWVNPFYLENPDDPEGDAIQGDAGTATLISVTLYDADGNEVVPGAGGAEGGDSSVAPEGGDSSVAAGGGEDSSAASSAAESTANSTANSSRASGGSTGGSNNGGNAGGGTTTAASSTDAVDNTNQATGATAGLALAGLALAGAVAVVSKRK